MVRQTSDNKERAFFMGRAIRMAKMEFSTMPTAAAVFISLFTELTKYQKCGTILPAFGPHALKARRGTRSLWLTLDKGRTCGPRVIKGAAWPWYSTNGTQAKEPYKDIAETRQRAVCGSARRTAGAAWLES